MEAQNSSGVLVIASFFSVFGEFIKLVIKTKQQEKDQWEKITFSEYYHGCQMGAKSFLKIKDRLPHMKAIIQYSASLQKKLPNLYSWEKFMGLDLNITDKTLDDISSSQKAKQCYTSGTTGMPKGATLSHDNVCVPGA